MSKIDPGNQLIMSSCLGCFVVGALILGVLVGVAVSVQ